MGYFLAALLGGFFLFNSAVTPQKAAEKAQQALQKTYPNSKVHVEIEGKRGKDVLKGRFKRILIQMSDLTLANIPFTPSKNAKHKGHAGDIELELRNVQSNGLPISLAHFDFHDVEYDLDALKKKSQFQIVRTGPAHMQLQMSAAALSPVFFTKLKDITNASLSFGDDQFHIGGEKVVMGFSAPFEVNAHPFGLGNQLRLENPNIKVGGLPVPVAAGNTVLNEMNPIYVFDRNGDWPFKVDIQKVTAQNDILDVTADLSLKPAP